MITLLKSLGYPAPDTKFVPFPLPAKAKFIQKLVASIPQSHRRYSGAGASISMTISEEAAGAIEWDRAKRILKIQEEISEIPDRYLSKRDPYFTAGISSSASSLTPIGILRSEVMKKRLAPHEPDYSSLYRHDNFLSGLEKTINMASKTHEREGAVLRFLSSRIGFFDQPLGVAYVFFCRLHNDQDTDILAIENSIFPDGEYRKKLRKSKTLVEKILKQLEKTIDTSDSCGWVRLYNSAEGHRDAYLKSRDEMVGKLEEVLTRLARRLHDENLQESTKKGKV